MSFPCYALILKLSFPLLLIQKDFLLFLNPLLHLKHVWAILYPALVEAADHIFPDIEDVFTCFTFLLIFIFLNIIIELASVQL